MWGATEQAQHAYVALFYVRIDLGKCESRFYQKRLSMKQRFK
jgi:hypothetical protein